MTLKARLIGLLDYVEELARLPERAILSVRNYRTLLFHEQQLRGKVGIHHDVADEDGAIWLRIDRLQRQKPPLPDEAIRPWMSVGNDPAKAPEVRDAIIMTMTRNEAKDLVEQGLVEVDDVMESPKGELELVDVRLLLDRLPNVSSSIQEYLASSWTQWSAAEIPRRETIAIYDKFFSVLQTIETAGVDNPLEMVFGVGFALWKTQERTVEHPIVEAFVEASIDPRTHAIQVRARETELQVYLKPFLELDNAAVPALRKRALSHIERLSGTSTDATPAAEFSPFIPGTFEPILRDAVTLLSPEARYWPDVADDPDNRALPEIADVLTITDNWAIYVRPRSGNLFAQDLGRLKKSIESSNEDELPPVGRRLVTRPRDLVDVTIGPDLSGGLGTTWNQSPVDTARQETDHTDVLFPKPFNDAQVEIIRRLKREEGVVVQGPPGTGKTHTIANIICHYLATGRSVLVVSKGEPALEVLRSQIPDEVRNFAISLLTSERQGLKQLEHAVEFMDHAANKDPARLDRERVEREKEILSLRQEAEKVDTKVMAWAQKQLENVPEDLCVGSQQWPAELAQLLASERQRDQWLEDDLGPGEEYQPIFTQQHLDDLRAARCRLGEDLFYLGTKTPNRNDLPDAQTISEIHANLLEAATLANTAEQKQLPSMVLRTDEAAERAERLQCDLLDLRSFLHEIDGQDWVRKLYET